MHPNCKLNFEGGEFSTFELLRWGYQKTLLFTVLFVDPLFGRLPSKRAISNHNLFMLCLSYHYCIGHPITLFVESFGREIILSRSIQQMNVVNIFFHCLLKITEVVSQQTRNNFSFTHEGFLNYF